MERMAAFSTEDRMPRGAPVPAGRFDRGPLRRRRISPNAGRALEMLGHAIQYLTDEYVHRGGSFSARNGEVAAVQLLMEINRQIYFDCPAVPTIADRCRSLLRLRAA